MDPIGEEKVLNIGIDGKDVYVQGVSHNLPEAWIKGTMSDDGKSITFESFQYYGSYNDTYDIWFVACNPETNEAVPITVTYDAEAGVITWPTNPQIVENGSKDELKPYGFYEEIVATVKGTAPDPQEPADNLKALAQEYRLTATETSDNSSKNYGHPVFVVYDDNTIWIKGVSEDLPEAWVKGTYNPNTNKVTFPKGQHLGTYTIWFWNYEYFLTGYGENGFEDIVMTRDATGKLTLEGLDTLLINSYWLIYDPVSCLSNVVITPIPDVTATPARPIITGSKLKETSYPYIDISIPITDVDSKPILTTKLSYRYYYEVDHTANPLTLTTNNYCELSSDMTEIPYGFTDHWDIYNYRLYLNMDFSTWNRVGIQSIYRGGGEERTSDIFWYTINPYICDVALANNTKEATNWKAAIGDGELQALPLADVASSDTIAISYSGLLKVKGVTAQFSVGDKTENAKIVAGTAANTWTMTEFLDDVTLNVEYYPVATMTVAPKAPAAVYASEDMALVSNGQTNDGTIMYALSQSNTEVPTTFTTTVPNAKSFTTQNTYYVWYYIVGDNTHNDSEPQYVTVKVSDPLPVIKSPYIYDDDDPVIVAHKLALITILNKAQSINLKDMSTASIQNLKDAIANAEDALKDKDVADDELDAAREALIKAIDELQPKSDDENEDLLQPTNNEQEPKSTDNEAQPKSTNSEAEVVTTIGRVASDSTTDYYDLQGRKVKNPKKGIYIYKGKKVKR
jgi:hypothetical protein